MSGLPPFDDPSLGYVISRDPGRGRLAPPVAALDSDAGRLDLGGDWRFAWSPTARSPHAVEDPALDDSGWETLRIPGHWVLPPDGRHGAPAYTNVNYPIPLDPPHVPDENPTGDHRRWFDLPEDWQGGRILLRTDGIESVARIWVNGAEAGVRTGSRLVQDLDVTEFLVPGRNLLSVRVHQWSAGTYVEDQDQWWLPGIFREVTLLHRPVGSLDDVWIRADLVPATGTGLLAPEISCGPAAWPVTFSVPEAGLEVTWQGPEDIRPLELPDVRPWSAESPVLYEVRLRSAAETVTLRTGFRRVEAVGGVLTANGRPLTLRGMNRHEIDTREGRVFDEDRAREDLLLMKRHHVDAIRTAHYPPHPRLLDLADELGFWVMVECDVETHGFEAAGWQGNPAHDPAWRENLLDRARRMVERDKNHPCVFSWSLGNECGTGGNLAAMAAWIKERDPGRLVHYEGDHAARYTEIYSRMYPAFEEIEAFLSPEGPLAVPHHAASRVTPGEAARARKLPFVMIEYLHAMGTGPGGAAGYGRLVDSSARLAGGFVWEWRDHTLLAHREDGTPYQAYGGDFGEPLHDGNFLADGMVLADSTPTQGLLDWAQSVAPVRVRWDDGIVVDSRRQFTTTEDLAVRWSVEVDGFVHDEGWLPCGAVPPAAVRSLGTPEELSAALAAAEAEGGELTRTLQIVLARATPWAEAGHVCHTAQEVLTPAAGTRREPSAPAAGPALADRPAVGELRAGPARFAAGSGLLTRLGDLAVTELGVELWRAPTDNDNGHGALDYSETDPRTSLGAGAGRRGPSSADRWAAAGLHRLVRLTRGLRTGPGGGLLVASRTAPAAEPFGVAATLLWESVGDGEVRCSVDLTPEGPWRTTWPRAAVHFFLPYAPQAPDGPDPSSADWTLDWHGYGPGESYPDMRAAVRLGRWSSPVDSLAVARPHPQESGHRSGVRSFRLHRPGGPGLALRVREGELGVTVLRHSAQEIGEARHPDVLPVSRGLHVYLDLGQHGTGSRACGPDVRPEYALRPTPLRAVFEWRSVTGM
ncbi:glycoside hydrolase family 2 TIM barrel-domain containing protein [Streptomyces sp. NPDC050422]|uniref:glycoside hydrolase family 2 TIM barrel-domain containing protein n=1 Tax=Streptomyces sp. NPDC050422 TaxID=3365614 RepID=UPI00379E082A